MMENDNKPDLTSILENAREHLENYRQTSHDDIKQIAKEIMLTRTEESVEDKSGPLFNQSSEDSSSSRERASDNTEVEEKESKESRSQAEEEPVEEEDSSNKNFDSSTISLGEQQSFQNQTELTSQTTYTNIHELAGPVKEDILVVTGEVIDTSTGGFNAANLQETTGAASILDSPQTQKPDQNQMGTLLKTPAPTAPFKSEIIVKELLPQQRNREEVVDKGDVCVLAGAGTREGSPVGMTVGVINQLVNKLSELNFTEGDEWLANEIDTKPVSDKVNDKNYIRDEGIIKNVGRVLMSFDNPILSQCIKTCVDNSENRTLPIRNQVQIDVVDNVNNPANIDNISDSFEDEGFVDSKDLLQTTKIIFVSEQEDEKSSKPFETEDINSCSTDTILVGSDLQPTLSMTNIRTKMENDDEDVHKTETDNSLSNNQKDQAECQQVKTSLPEVLNNMLHLTPSQVLKPEESIELMSNSANNPPVNSEPLLEVEDIANYQERQAISRPKIVAFKKKSSEKSNYTHVSKDSLDHSTVNRKDNSPALMIKEVELTSNSIKDISKKSVTINKSKVSSLFDHAVQDVSLSSDADSMNNGDISIATKGIFTHYSKQGIPEKSTDSSQISSHSVSVGEAVTTAFEVLLPSNKILSEGISPSLSKASPLFGYQEEVITLDRDMTSSYSNDGSNSLKVTCPIVRDSNETLDDNISKRSLPDVGKVQSSGSSKESFPTTGGINVIFAPTGGSKASIPSVSKVSIPANTGSKVTFPPTGSSKVTTPSDSKISLPPNTGSKVTFPPTDSSKVTTPSDSKISFPPTSGSKVTFPPTGSSKVTVASIGNSKVSLPATSGSEMSEIDKTTYPSIMDGNLISHPDDISNERSATTNKAVRINSFSAEGIDSKVSSPIMSDKDSLESSGESKLTFPEASDSKVSEKTMSDNVDSLTPFNSENVSDSATSESKASPLYVSKVSVASRSNQTYNKSLESSNKDSFSGMSSDVVSMTEAIDKVSFKVINERYKSDSDINQSSDSLTEISNMDVVMTSDDILDPVSLNRRTLDNKLVESLDRQKKEFNRPSTPYNEAIPSTPTTDDELSVPQYVISPRPKVEIVEAIQDNSLIEDDQIQSTPKSPPRPPPRMRTQKKNKFNIFRKIFGRKKTKSVS